MWKANWTSSVMVRTAHVAVIVSGHDYHQRFLSTFFLPFVGCVPLQTSKYILRTKSLVHWVGPVKRTFRVTATGAHWATNVSNATDRHRLHAASEWGMWVFRYAAVCFVPTSLSSVSSHFVRKTKQDHPEEEQAPRGRYGEGTKEHHRPVKRNRARHVNSVVDQIASRLIERTPTSTTRYNLEKDLLLYGSLSRRG